MILITLRGEKMCAQIAAFDRTQLAAFRPAKYCINTMLADWTCMTSSHVAIKINYQLFK